MTKKADQGQTGGGPPSPVSQRDQEVQDQLQTLREEHRKLHEQKIATERDRQNLEERLRELREQAQREYGTDDLDHLRQLLEQRRRENDRMVAEYQQHIQDIQGRLREVDNAASEEH
jgi:hypothetical protein